jgi:hypothetical protein
MPHTRLLIAAAIIAVVLVAGFALSVPHTRDVVEEIEISSEEQIPTVTIRDAVKNGVHTITGSLKVPNACTAITAEARLIGEDGAQSILVTITMPKYTEVCLQMPTTENFSVSIEAPARLPITATVNDATAEVETL